MSHQSSAYSYNTYSFEANPAPTITASHTTEAPSYQISSNFHNQYTYAPATTGLNFVKPTSGISAVSSETGVTSTNTPLSYYHTHSQMENKPYVTNDTSNYGYAVPKVSDQSESVFRGENTLKYPSVLSVSHYGLDTNINGQSVANQTFPSSYQPSAHPISYGERTNEIKSEHSRPEQATKSSNIESLQQNGSTREFSFELSRPKVEHSGKSLMTRFINPDDLLPEARHTYERPVISLKDRVPEQNTETVKQAVFGNQTSYPINPADRSSETTVREFSFERSRPQVEHSRKALVTRFIDPEDLLPEARHTYERPVISLKDKVPEKNTETDKKAAFGKDAYSLQDSYQNAQAQRFSDPIQAATDEKVREFTYEISRPQIQHAKKSLITRFIDPDDLLPEARQSYERPVISLKSRASENPSETVKQASPQKQDYHRQVGNRTSKSFSIPVENGAVVREFSFEHSRPQVEQSRKALVTRFIDPDDLLPEARHTYERPVISLKDQVLEKNIETNKKAVFIKNTFTTEPSGEENIREFSYEFSRPQVQNSGKPLTTRFINPDDLLPSAKDTYQRPVTSLKDRVPERNGETVKQAIFGNQTTHLAERSSEANLREFTYEHSRPQVEHSRKALVTRFIDPDDLLPEARQTYQKPVISLKDNALAKTDNTRELTYDVSRPKVEHSSKASAPMFMPPENLLLTAQDIYQRPIISLKDKLPEKKDEPTKPKEFDKQDYYQYLGPINKEVKTAPVELPPNDGNLREFSYEVSRPKVEHNSKSLVTRFVAPEDLLPAARETYQRPIISLKDKLPGPNMEISQPVVFEKKDYYQQLQTQIEQANNFSMQGAPYQNTREFSFEISRPKVEHNAKSLVTRFIDPDDLLPEARGTYQKPVITQKQTMSNVPENKNELLREVSFERKGFNQQYAESDQAEKAKKAQQAIRRVIDPDDMLPAKKKEHFKQQQQQYQEQVKKSSLPSNNGMGTQGSNSDTYGFVQREREVVYNVSRLAGNDTNRFTQLA